jgi:hypothetical protein
VEDGYTVLTTSIKLLDGKTLIHLLIGMYVELSIMPEDSHKSGMTEMA